MTSYPGFKIITRAVGSASRRGCRQAVLSPAGQCEPIPIRGIDADTSG